MQRSTSAKPRFVGICEAWLDPDPIRRSYDRPADPISKHPEYNLIRFKHRRARDASQRHITDFFSSHPHPDLPHPGPSSLSSAAYDGPSIYSNSMLHNYQVPRIPGFSSFQFPHPTGYSGLVVYYDELQPCRLVEQQCFNAVAVDINIKSQMVCVAFSYHGRAMHYYLIYIHPTEHSAHWPAIASILARHLSVCKSSDYVIAGDFNCHNTSWGDYRTSPKSLPILSFAEANGVYNINESYAPLDITFPTGDHDVCDDRALDVETKCSTSAADSSSSTRHEPVRPRALTGTVIDLAFTSVPSVIRSMDVLHDLFSDHFAIEVRLEEPDWANRPTPRRRTGTPPMETHLSWDKKRLADTNWNEYSTTLAVQCRSWLDQFRHSLTDPCHLSPSAAQDLVDWAWSTLSSLITTTASLHVRQRRITPFSKGWFGIKKFDLPQRYYEYREAQTYRLNHLFDRNIIHFGFGAGQTYRRYAAWRYRYLHRLFNQAAKRAKQHHWTELISSLQDQGGPGLSDANTGLRSCRRIRWAVWTAMKENAFLPLTSITPPGRPDRVPLNTTESLNNLVDHYAAVSAAHDVREFDADLHQFVVSEVSSDFPICRRLEAIGPPPPPIPTLADLPPMPRGMRSFVMPRPPDPFDADGVLRSPLPALLSNDVYQSVHLVTNPIRRTMSDPPPRPPDPAPDMKRADRDFSIAEIAQACERAKSTAPGPDAIMSEFIRFGGPPLHECLHLLLNFAWRRRIVPGAFRWANVISLYKLKGDRSQAANYRPISLTSVIARIYERLVLPRILELFPDCKVHAYQFGFRKSHSTLDNLFILDAAVRRALHNARVLPVTFIDVSKAYDRIWLDGLFFKLWQNGVRGNTYHFIKQFCSARQIKDHVPGQVRASGAALGLECPGSVIACMLFLIYINDVKSINTNGLTHSQLFADDIAVWPTTPVHNWSRVDVAADLNDHRSLFELNQALYHISRWAHRWKMTFSADKSQTVLFCNPTRRSPPGCRVATLGEYADSAPRVHLCHDPDRPLAASSSSSLSSSSDGPSPLQRRDSPAAPGLYSSPISYTESYKYMGLMFQQDGGWHQQNRAVLQKINKSAWVIAGFNRRTDVVTPIIRQLCVAVMKAQIAYGIQFWDPSKLVARKLNSLLIRPVRIAMGQPSSVHALSLHKEAHLLPVDGIRTAATLNYFARLQRLQHSHSAAIVYDELLDTTKLREQQYRLDSGVTCRHRSFVHKLHQVMCQLDAVQAAPASYEHPPSIVQVAPNAYLPHTQQLGFTLRHIAPAARPPGQRR